LGAVRPYLPYALGGGLAGATLCIAGWCALKSGARLILTVPLVCVLLGPLAVSAVFSQVSLHPRYFTAGAPLLLVLLAAGMPAPGSERWRWGAAILLTGLMGGASAFELTHPGHKREDVTAAGAWLDRNVPVEEEILVTSEEMMSLASYHWPRRRVRLYPADDALVTADSATALAQGLPFQDKKRLIYVFGRSWVSDPEHVLERTIQDCYRLCEGTRVRSIRIHCLLPPDAGAPRGERDSENRCRAPSAARR
jgi:hypothetical protein